MLSKNFIILSNSLCLGIDYMETFSIKVMARSGLETS